MAVKKVAAQVKLQLPSGSATPAPPVGTALGPRGINIAEFVRIFNEKTMANKGLVVTTLISIYQDRSFTVEIKTPPVTTLIKKEAGIEKGSGVPNKDKVGKLTKAQVKAIAETKMPDLNTMTLEAAMKSVEGSARSMGVEIVG